MNAPDRAVFHPAPPETLDDTQSSPDARHLPIQRVGIKALRYPMQIIAGNGETQGTVATFAMYVGLPEHVKGTHMSRFIQLLETRREALDTTGFLALEAEMRARLEADTGYLEMSFPYFRRKAAPVSGVESLLDADVTWLVETSSAQGTRLTIQVVAPVTSLCPCSKKISDYGAHNQRSHITIRAEAGVGLTAEALIDIAEREASAELFGVLKRADEKFVTERAYDNPKFVEDLVRDIALACQAHPQMGDFMVASENFEAIHNHSAYAEIYGRGGLTLGV
ncbi:MAG: GTP cyclohydrolase I FolE2 [Burkholderiales bacterium]|nr:GTP cyclohydrolase I FolE2 [Burkholderiales bacterium]